MTDPVLAHHQLDHMPFGPDIPTRYLAESRTHLEATARLGWAITNKEISVLTGDVGCGKTVALRSCVARLDPARHLTIYIPNPSIGLKGIHSHIVTALGGQPRHYGAQVAVQAASLITAELDEKGRLPVLAVDEAHLLTDTDLEALRMMTNTDLDTGSTFTLVLIGQPTLRRRLRHASLAALDQRVTTRYQLVGMTPHETNSYLKAHLAWAGRTTPLFTDDAVNAICQATRGLPRAVNSLARAALIASCTTEKTLIDHTTTQTAITETTEP